MLIDPAYTLLHIVCHGRVIKGRTVLYLSNDNKQVEPVMDRDLIQEFQHLGSKDSLPYLTFLCSCSSGSPLGKLTQSFVQKLAMPAVVAMSHQVSVKTAIALAQGFYPRLRQLGAVDIAGQQATTGLAERYDITVPALYSRLGHRLLFEIDDNNKSIDVGVGFQDDVSVIGDVVGRDLNKTTINHHYHFPSSDQTSAQRLPFAPAAQGKSVRKGIQALAELMSNTEARDVVVAFRTDFQAACDPITILSTYKNLHNS
ncbi:MAG: CHAT domain-containing protein [Microcoleaceae cyanobacterium]